MIKRKNKPKRGGWIQEIGNRLPFSVKFETSLMFDRDTLEHKISEITAVSEVSIQYKAFVTRDDESSFFVVERIRQYPKIGIEVYIIGQCIDENDGLGTYVTGKVHPNGTPIFAAVFSGIFLYFAFEQLFIVALLALLVTGFYIKASLEDRDKTLEFFMDYLHDKAKYKKAQR